ncbi:hypothetical protein LTS18_006862, partial [Coniosporium uncinatum]
MKPFGRNNVSNPFQHLNQHHNVSSQFLQQQQLQAQQRQLGQQNFGAQDQSNGFSGFGQQGNPASFSSAAFSSGAPGMGAGGGTGLASHAAQMGFANAAMPQQQTHEAGMPGTATKGLGGRVREVWKGNLEQEMRILRSLVDKYPYISMDTEFPGVVARPMGDFVSKASYHYQTLRCNVDLLKIISLGITLFNVAGETPPAHADPALLAQRPASLPSNLI